MGLGLGSRGKPGVQHWPSQEPGPPGPHTVFSPMSGHVQFPGLGPCRVSWGAWWKTACTPKVLAFMSHLLCSALGAAQCEACPPAQPSASSAQMLGSPGRGKRKNLGRAPGSVSHQALAAPGSVCGNFHVTFLHQPRPCLALLWFQILIRWRAAGPRDDSVPLSASQDVQ